MAAAATLVAASSSYQDDVLSSSSLSFSSVYAEISACKSEFRIPTHMLQNDSYNDDTIRDYIWENYQNQLKQSITIQVSVDQLATKRANNRLKLLDKISQVQRQYLLNEEVCVHYDQCRFTALYR